MRHEILVEKSSFNEKLENRQDLVELVRKWGEVNTDGILDPSCKIFSDSKIDGLIGYRIEAGHAVVFGDPVSDPKNKGILAFAFQKFCEEQKLGVVYTMASEEFTHWCAEHLSGILIEFGEKFVLDPLNNPMDNTGSKAILVRKKVKQALREGVDVQEHTGNDPLFEEKLDAVAKVWLQKRKGPQVYLSHINLFEDRYGKRWFYASQQDQIVGILLLNELQFHQGWLLNNLMITKEAPNGTSELLVVSALKILNQENCRFVLIGPVPAKQLGKITALNGFAESFTRWIYRCAKKIFHLEGHKVFWEKFQPTVESSYLFFPKNNLSFSSAKALLQAFNVVP
jgi:lysylphosphatidylglycerol synthetase-like protein (DUF2156 family)